MRGMAKLPPSRRRTGRGTDQTLVRVGIGVLAVIAAIMVLNMVLGWLFSLIRIALLLALLGIVVWFVLIGPPGMDE